MAYNPLYIPLIYHLYITCLLGGDYMLPHPTFYGNQKRQKRILDAGFSYPPLFLAVIHSQNLLGSRCEELSRLEDVAGDRDNCSFAKWAC